MATPKRIPINRITKWFSQEDFNLEIEMGREALEGDGNFVLILYRVDRIMTGSDDLYGEASKDNIKFLPPVELRVIPNMNEPESKTYSKGMGRYLQDGKLEFEIYEAQLAELDVELNYGDYIGYPVTETEVRFFSVVNDGIKFFDNEHTIMGYKGAFRSVSCAPVDEDEFTSK